MNQQPVYLDHAASTPMLPAALEVWARESAVPGNPSSIHAAGRRARRVVEESRETVAAALGARPLEVVFTSGGTEADNIALIGMFQGIRAADPKRNRVMVSAIEHDAVLESAFSLASRFGADVSVLPVQADGRLDLAAAEAEITRYADSVALVSVMWANNETGVIQPVRQVVELAHKVGAVAHSDAVQAAGPLALDFAASGLDAMSVSAHKLGGPVGVGALVVRRDVPIVALSHGGGQERSVRSGTVDTAGVAAFAEAMRWQLAHRAEHGAHLAALRDRLAVRITELVPGSRLTSDDVPDDLRLPGIAHLTFEGCEGDALLYLLDSHGISVSTGSACRAGVPEPSHVLLAMGRGEEQARGALRFSLGQGSTDEDVDRVIAALPEAVQRARAAGLVTQRQETR